MLLSKGAGEKEEILGIAFRYLEIPLCSPAPLQSLRRLPFSLTSVPFPLRIKNADYWKLFA
ncbi:hypothetical protein H6G97_41160 [Nostoc flagelliforme FACHB-838]|uniref:Uncharacterized protein n=1 Tax=Nostoc flagelliforme FACHB-838 TaxID=2692904 RepID=A0ABR8E2Z3_9NOSO|nr:hypothetical protein [Nostoc flagelliforme FACHB-838]